MIRIQNQLLFLCFPSVAASYSFSPTTAAAAAKSSPSQNRSFSSKSTIPDIFVPLRNPHSGPAVLISEANQIHFNLALELYLTRVVKPLVPLFFWWRNDRNVVIGKYQNPWRECAVDKMNEDGVQLARRTSGGGSVYQDLQNSVFSFLAPSAIYDQNLNNSILLNTLSDVFGIKGKVTGRNDLVIEDGRKFSGSAYHHIKEPVYCLSSSGPGPPRGLSIHHGTLLVKVDLEALQKYLTPHKLKLQAKGIQSVVSRVVNLSDLNDQVQHESLTEPLMREFYKQYGLKQSTVERGGGREKKAETVTQSSDFTSDPEFGKIMSQLTDWNWRFGATPDFTQSFEKRFEFGIFEVYLNVAGGSIESVKIYSDCLLDDFVPFWEQLLKNSSYNAESVKLRLQKTEFPLDPENPDEVKFYEKFSCWILEEFSKIDFDSEKNLSQVTIK